VNQRKWEDAEQDLTDFTITQKLETVNISLTVVVKETETIFKQSSYADNSA